MLTRYVQKTSRIKYKKPAKSGMMNGRKRSGGDLEFSQDLHAPDAVQHKSRSEESLDLLPYSRFCQKITTGTSFVQPECLLPTSAASVYHSLRIYHQVQQWRGVALSPEDWGWKRVDGRLLPVRSELRAVHASLVEIVRCNCKSDCGFQRCSCKKHGLDSFAFCGTSRGKSCTYSVSPDLGKNDE